MRYSGLWLPCGVSPAVGASFGALLPRLAVYPIAMGAELLARMTGRVPFVTRDGLRMSRRHMYFVDTKARRDLGYASRPYCEGIVDAIAWFDQAGYLRRSA